MGLTNTLMALFAILVWEGTPQMCKGVRNQIFLHNVKCEGRAAVVLFSSHTHGNQSNQLSGLHPKGLTVTLIAHRCCKEGGSKKSWVGNVSNIIFL